MTMQQEALPAPEDSTSRPLDDRYDALDGTLHLSGLQALVRLPMDARRLDLRRGADTSTFISGYEGSPLGGYDLQLARQAERLQEHQIVFSPSVNEELAATAVQGTQLASASADRICDGVIGIWYGKAPGLDRASDAIRHSNLAGTHPSGGVLALVGDDSTAKSSTVPSSSEVAIAELGMPCLAPADPEDILRLGLHGIAMSRASGLWVAMKLATTVVDGSSTTGIDLESIDPIEPDRKFGGREFTHEVTGRMLQPTLGALEATQSHERMELARRYARVNALNTIIGDPDATLGIVCAGATYREVRDALAEMGVDDESVGTSGVRILKLGMVFPLEPAVIDDFAAGLTEIIVVEEKKAFLELAVKDALYGRASAPRVLGRRDENGAELFRAHSDLPASYIATRLAPRVQQHGGPASVAEWIGRAQSARRMPKMLPMVSRSPYFCSGCPHNRSTRVPEGALVGGGIGCHALVAMLPEDRAGDLIGLSAMGTEGAAWIGMASFVRSEHLFQNIGDGTFHHSGSLAIRAAIASGANMTYKLLYNDAVAMTGGQDAVGKMSIPRVSQELLAEGVKQIIITSDEPKRSRRQFDSRLPKGVSIRHRDDLITVQEELAGISGVTVLIHDQECATELRRKRKRGLVAAPRERILINERVCEGCGDCGEKSNCLSVQPVDTEFGRKTQIHQASCNLDFSCIQGDCPSFVEVIPGKRKSSRPQRRRSQRELPPPVRRIAADDFSMRICGVGGTGVVTVSQVLAAAASRAGLHVAGLDQLGLAQKGGAVVSDVRLSTSPISGSNKIGPGGCDLYLGCDILVAAAETNLAVLAPGRSYAVISTSQTPTGQMVTDTRTAFPAMEDLRERIEWTGSRPENVFVDARHHVSSELGDDQYANVFLLGTAVQAGVLPIDPEHVEWALELNGVQVERNIEAFRLGRQHVAHGDSTPRTRRARSKTMPTIVRAGSGSTLSDIVTRRFDELTAYQNAGYARRYATEVEKVRAVEESALGSAGALAEEFARQLFKVMAYKDEYEVARLLTDPDFERSVHEQFGRDARVSYLLHPPILRAMGAKSKIRLQSWWAKYFMHALAYARRLRGTPLDVFGYLHVRRAERALVTDYVETVHRALSALRADTVPLIAEVVSLPEWIRGYEDIKMRSLESYYDKRTQLLERLSGTTV